MVVKKQFIQDGGSGSLVELEGKVFEEQRAMDPQEPIIHQPIVDASPLLCRSGRVFYPPDRYIGMLIEKIEEIFLMGDKSHGNDPNTFDEMMSDIDFDK